MNCPHCGKPLPSKLAAKTLGSIKSERKAAASRANGAKSKGRPKKKRRPDDFEDSVFNRRWIEGYE